MSKWVAFEPGLRIRESSLGEMNFYLAMFVSNFSMLTPLLKSDPKSRIYGFRMKVFSERLLFGFDPGLLVSYMALHSNFRLKAL